MYQAAEWSPLFDYLNDFEIRRNQHLSKILPNSAFSIPFKLTKISFLHKIINQSLKVILSVKLFEIGDRVSNWSFSAFWQIFSCIFLWNLSLWLQYLKKSLKMAWKRPLLTPFQTLESRDKIPIYVVLICIFFIRIKSRFLINFVLQRLFLYIILLKFLFF